MKFKSFAILAVLFFTALITSAQTATFVKTETTTTQATAVATYGADGYFVAKGTPHVPSYVLFTETPGYEWTWAVDGNTCWYGNPMNLNFNFTDGNTHQIALYVKDDDGQGRIEQIQVLNTATSAVLNTQSVSRFQLGETLVWSVSGSITFQFTNTAGPNAVVTSFYLSTPSGTVTPPPPPPPGLTPPTPTISVTSSAPGSYNLSVTGVAGQNVSVSVATPTGTIPASGSFVSPITVAFGHVVALNWTASVSTGVTGYDIYRGTVSGGPYSLIGSATGTSYFDANAIVSGTTYYYVVTAQGSGSTQSGNSNQVSVLIPTP
jgi:hypothetical protein